MENTKFSGVNKTYQRGSKYLRGESKPLRGEYKSLREAIKKQAPKAGGCAS